MLFFRLLYKAVPYLFKVLKYLEKRKSSIIYSVVYVKIITSLIDFIISGQRLGYFVIIKGVYYFLTILNVLLAAFVLGFFSDINFNLDLPLINVLWSGFLALIPAMVIDWLTNLFINYAESIRRAAIRFLNWVYSDGSYKPRVKQWSKGISDPFSNIHNQGIGGDSTPLLDTPLDEAIEKEHVKATWTTIIIFTVGTIAVTYYFFPDLYHAAYQWAKGKIWPDGGVPQLVGRGVVIGPLGIKPIKIKVSYLNLHQLTLNLL
jgi:hypothetical protein